MPELAYSLEWVSDPVVYWGSAWNECLTQILTGSYPRIDIQVLLRSKLGSYLEWVSDAGLGWVLAWNGCLMQVLVRF